MSEVKVPTYKKRGGTSGISGQLYETKLISLILFRLQHDADIEEFYLASNMDDIGAFDDICFKIKLVNNPRPVYAFIQSKHKLHRDSYLIYDLINSFYSSYVKVNQQFYINKDVFFKEEFKNTDCVFILYTNAKYCDDSVVGESQQTGSNPAQVRQARRAYESSFSDKLNRLISTGENGSQADYTAEDLVAANDIIAEAEIKTLAEIFAKFILVKPKQCMNIMLEKYIVKYHVILAKNVVDISAVKSDKSGQPCRVMTFQSNFLSSDLKDEKLVMLRNRLYEQVIKNQSKNQKKKKKSAQINDSETGETASLSSEDSEAAKKVLLGITINVPVTFGNIDMTISGSGTGVEDRLDTLVKFFETLRTKSQQINSNVVTIDKTDGEGFLKSKNGIGSAVGNLLIHDYETKYLKFTQDSEPSINPSIGLSPSTAEQNSPQESASSSEAMLCPEPVKENYRKLFDKLNLGDVNNSLHMLRFDAKAVMFPKLVFDYTEEAKLMLNQVVVYDKQSDQDGVEIKLKDAIENSQTTYNPHSLTISTETLIIFYHKQIQDWWMTLESGTYFNKHSDEYQKAINIIIEEPQMSAMQTAFNVNTKKYFGYNFTEDATDTMRSLGVHTKTVVVTELSTLTTVKVIQCLRNQRNSDYAVLDLEYILDLPAGDADTLNEELKKTKKILIIICDTQNLTLQDKLNETAKHIAELVEEKKVIVVANSVLATVMQTYFLKTQNVLNDQNQSIKDLSPNLRKEIIKNAKVIFQGEAVSLDLLVDDVSETYVKGDVLNKIVRNEIVTLGKSLSSQSYEEIKHLYVDRRVSLGSKDDNFRFGGDDHTLLQPFFVRKFSDINKNVVLITATPGMGKSTLLTHLSITTKALDKKLWIVRVNLLDFSKIFHCWKVDKTVINILETLKFICHVILNNNNMLIFLKEIDNKVYLDSCTGDEWAIFEINMFLHYYNEKQVLFLFDGFDEICPQYKEKVFEFLNVVKQFPRQHTMWVTSRPYSEILIDLERILCRCHEMEYINDSEQDIYLNKCWQGKFKIDKLNETQLNNVISFIDFMLRKNDPSFGRIAYLFYDHVNWYFPHVDTQPRYSKYRSVAHVPNLINIMGERIQKSVDIIMGTPLLLYLYAEYFINEVCIKGITEFNKLDVAISTLTIYETFIEMKLKKILFEEKNKMIVYNPDIIKIYRKERADCVRMHKKIAAYDILFRHLNMDEFKETGPFNNEGLIEYGTIVYEIKNGLEKSGFISHVTDDNVPVFIYRTLAEYFAAEFICDIFKSNDFGFGHKNILYTLMTLKYEVLTWINKKRKVDNELNSILTYIELKRPAVIDCYGFLFGNGWPLEQIIRIRSSVAEDYDTTCFDEYNHSSLSILRKLPQEEAPKYILEFQKNVIGKMKPHLRKYFINILEMFCADQNET